MQHYTHVVLKKDTWKLLKELKERNRLASIDAVVKQLLEQECEKA